MFRHIEKVLTLEVAGKLDLMITVPCKTADAIEWTTLRECGWRLAVSPKHRLATAESVTPADLNDDRLLLFDREQYPDYWAHVTGYFKEHGIQAKVAGEFDGIASLAAAVEANLGCAIIAATSRLVRDDDKRVVTRPMNPQPASFIIAAGVVARDAPPHVLAFIEEMKLYGNHSSSLG